MHPALRSASAFAMVLTAFPALSQDIIEFPDSLLFGASAEVLHVDNLDSSLTISTQFPEVNAELVLLKAAWYGGVYKLAVTSDTGYDLYAIHGGPPVDSIDISTVDLRGNGQLQVVVRTMSYSGHTGWEHAIHEREWAVQVWDLQERRCLLDMVNGHSHEEWTNTWAPDSTGMIPYEERTLLSSEGDISCELYEVSFAPGTMTMVRTDDCPDLEDHEAVPVNARVPVRYALGKDAWVKQ